MSIENRDTLKSRFQTGDKPTQTDFANLLDSFININDDGVSVDSDSNLILSRGLQLGNSNSTTPGTLRFNGVSVEFFDGSDWTEVGGGSSVFVDTGSGDVVYSAGNVGIGNLSADPSHVLDVALGENTGAGQRVRLGNVVCSNGPGTGAADAYVYHQNVDASAAYALRQRNSGEVHINAPLGESISLRHNSNNTRMVVTGDGQVVVGFNQVVPGSGGALFQVNGTAWKSGADTWDNTSDDRVKKDIRDLELGLDEIKHINPVRFRYTGAAGTPKDKEFIGIIGQQIEKIIPETVRKVPMGECNNTEFDDLRVYNSSALTYVLINAVKQLSTLFEQQENDINTLKKALHCGQVS